MPSSLARASERQPLERLVYFSDAVIAIALTLMALELPVPKGWEGFLELLPQEYLNFMISFAVIGVFWMAHNRVFELLDSNSPALMRLNLLHLFTIVLLPFATKVLSANSQIPFGVICYALVAAGAGGTLLATILLARRTGHLQENVSGATLRRLIARSVAPITVFLISIPVALVSPSAGKYTWLLIAVFSPAMVAFAGRARD